MITTYIKRGGSMKHFHSTPRWQPGQEVKGGDVSRRNRMNHH
jgi:hypothetical protein